MSVDRFPFPPKHSPPRRRILQGTLAAGVLTLAPGHVLAQAGVPLYKLPRYALAIGNSSYANAPLVNPANDAKAIAGELKAAGFEVSVQLDASREGMLKAIEAFSRMLAARNAVGLFYFAGHGTQLAWHNYLLPVDAEIRVLDDIPSRGVDLNALLQGLTRAKNPMNVIILDACRDNPFGKALPPQEKGLSQFDAPPGSLLAYATSPGNTASDGNGANGLYTENLLRELKAPDARIEDVFKRVRLSVRRSSVGQQIPWESTSLEEDFYFRPPKEVRKLSDDEATKRYEEQLVIWERIKATNDPAVLEDFLRRYPSGLFSEIAQLRLDQVLSERGERKIQIASSAQNPYSKGTAQVDTRLKPGDRFSYQHLNLETNQEIRKYTLVVSEITENRVVYNNGILITDLMGNPVKLSDGTRYTDAQHHIAEYSLGKRWTARHRLVKPNGSTYDSEIDYRVVAKERITVPAGTFDAFRIEGVGWSQSDKYGVNVYNLFWISPEVRRYVAHETRQRFANGKLVKHERYELTGYAQR
ncbi:MAG: caspase family protein [Dechloromonas sp.]|nr:caspase family protein [Dechloromonas sp.]